MRNAPSQSPFVSITFCRGDELRVDELLVLLLGVMADLTAAGNGIDGDGIKMQNFWQDYDLERKYSNNLGKNPEGLKSHFPKLRKKLLQ